MKRRPLRTVLYVEDDPQLRAVGRMALEVIGRYTVRDCGSSRDSLLAAASFTPDLIVLDVHESELEGLQTLARLRRYTHLQNTPVLFAASREAADGAGHLRAAGAIGVIARPVEPMRLAAQLHDFWQQHWSEREGLPELAILPVLR